MGLISASACTCLLLATGGSLAFPCLHQSAITQALRNSSQIIRVAEFGGSGRKTAEEYAKIHGQTTKQIEDRFASSGELKCGKWSSGAELVQTKSHVLVAMHGVFKDKTCEMNSPLNECSIRLKKDGKNQFFKVTEIVASGRPCPHPGGAYSNEDWAILKLDREATDFIPYKARNPRTIASRQVVAVGQSVDFFQPVGTKRYYPMHYSDCKMIDDNSDGTVSTNCGTSGSSSGSGIFDEDQKHPDLLGIAVTNSETAEIKEDEIKNHRVENRPYNAATWSSDYLPISGKLQETLNNLGKSNASSPHIDKTAPLKSSDPGTEL